MVTLINVLAEQREVILIDVYTKTTVIMITERESEKRPSNVKTRYRLDIERQKNNNNTTISLALALVSLWRLACYRWTLVSRKFKRFTSKIFLTLAND